MNRRYRELASLATLCFGIVVLVYKFLDGYIDPLQVNEALKQAILYFTSIGFYVILFRCVTFLYDHYLYKIVSRNKLIQGTWYYIQRVASDNSVRVGIAEIDYVNGEPMVSGTGDRYPENVFSNRWHSETVSFVNRQLIWSFESIGPRKEHVVRKGIIVASTKGRPPKIIYGYWTDIAPSGASGTITFYSEKEQFDAELLRIRNHNTKSAKAQLNGLA